MSEPPVDLPYRAEYAKSGRAACKGCKEIIAQGELRLAVMMQSPFFDGKTANWHHSKCFFTRQRPRAVGDFAHYDSLRWDDQEFIRKKIESSGGAGPSKKSANGVASGGVPLKDFSTEYAKSGGSTCKTCEIKISKGAVRIGKKEFESDRAKMYGPYDVWRHVDCFVKDREELEFYEGGDKIQGIKGLKVEDIKMLKEKIKKIERKRKAESESCDTPPTKKGKKEEDKEKTLQKEQNKLMFSYRDHLSKLEKKILVQLLEHNKQEVPVGVERMLDRLSDIMAFGALDFCKECSDGQLVYRTGVGYQCQGDLTAWTKCQVITNIPKRKVFEVPEDLKEEYVFLGKYKGKIRERMLPRHAPSASVSRQSSQSSSGVKNEALETGPLLKGLIFVLNGKFKEGTSADMKKILVSMGGRVASKVGEKTAALITTQKDFDKSGKRVEEAEKNNVQVLEEGFVYALPLLVKDLPSGIHPVSKRKNVLDLIKEKNIAQWGNEPSTRVFGADVVDSSLKSSKKSLFSKATSKQRLQLKGGVAVDPECDVADSTHVFQEKGKIYTVTLGAVDVQTGRNSFYKLQALKSDSGNKWYVFRAWGRVGTTIGGTKLEDMDGQDEAISEFRRLFEEKTGNVFGRPFVKRPGAYFPMDIDYGQDEKSLIKMEPSASSKLHQAVQELICMIFDVDSMKKALVEFEIDLDKMPLGKLSKRQIHSAYSILTELQLLLTDGGSDGKFLDASNRFYTLIPHDTGMEAPPVLKNKDIVQKKVMMLDNLLEIEVAYNMLDSGTAAGVDDHYKKLNADIDVIEKGTAEYKVIDKYLRHTHASTHTNYKLEIQQVFKVERHQESERYKSYSDLHNKHLLWHGSRTTNYAGILSQGLRIAPPEAPVTGYMFGKGLYFADMVSKSANYCNTTKTNNVGLLLLCEVPLGDILELKEACYEPKIKKKGKHSVKGIGRTYPNPNDTVVNDGVSIPIGKPFTDPNIESTLLYNEFIVYDEAQVNIKYLIKAKFNFKY